MKTTGPCAMALALALTTSTGFAQQQQPQQGAFQGPDYGPLPYDYGAVSYAMTELDSGGIELAGSFEVANRVIVFAGYEDWEIRGNIDRETTQLGGGYRWDVDRNVDIIAKLAYADTELDPPGPGNFDDQGFILSAQIRAWLSPDIELSGEILLDDSFGNDVETGLVVGGQYYLRNNISLGGRLRVDDDDTTVFLGARFHFGESSRILGNR